MHFSDAVNTFLLNNLYQLSVRVTILSVAKIPTSKGPLYERRIMLTRFNEDIKEVLRRIFTTVTPYKILHGNQNTTESVATIKLNH